MASDVRTAAVTALMQSISKSVEALDSATLETADKARVLRDLALAYRFAAGGTQPGSAVIEK